MASLKRHRPFLDKEVLAAQVGAFFRQRYGQVPELLVLPEPDFKAWIMQATPTSAQKEPSSATAAYKEDSHTIALLEQADIGWMRYMGTQMFVTAYLVRRQPAKPAKNPAEPTTGPETFEDWIQREYLARSMMEGLQDLASEHITLAALGRRSQDSPNLRDKLLWFGACRDRGFSGVYQSCCSLFNRFIEEYQKDNNELSAEEFTQMQETVASNRYMQKALGYITMHTMKNRFGIHAAVGLALNPPKIFDELERNLHPPCRKQYQ